MKINHVSLSPKNVLSANKRSKRRVEEEGGRGWGGSIQCVPRVPKTCQLKPLKKTAKTRPTRSLLDTGEKVRHPKLLLIQSFFLCFIESKFLPRLQSLASRLSSVFSFANVLQPTCHLSILWAPCVIWGHRHCFACWKWREKKLVPNFASVCLPSTFGNLAHTSIHSVLQKKIFKCVELYYY